MEDNAAQTPEVVQDVTAEPSVKKKQPFWKFKKKFPLIIGISVLIMIVLVVAVVWDLHSNQPENKQIEAANCIPDANLVNPCRPWVGAAANGNRGIPGQTAPGSDPISQYTYFEQLIGRPLDVFRDYHGGAPSLFDAEKYFANRANTYVNINWKPAGSFQKAMAVTQGGDQTVNDNIKTFADNIKALAPHKVFLNIWWEPQNDISAFDNSTQAAACQNDPNFKGLVGTAGKPSQYKAMWQNVENIFNNEGVTNVVWVMTYQGPYTGQWDCLVKPLWPGNSLVNWVTWDTYSRNSTTTWNNTVGRFYNLLKQDTTTETNFASKPFGVTEFGTCGNSDETVAQQYYIQAKQALDANAYPNIKWYMVYADTGNNSGLGCLTDYSNAGNYDSVKQTNFNRFFNDTIFSDTQPTPTSTPAPAQKPTPTPTPGSSNPSPSGRIHVNGTSILNGAGNHIHLTGTDEGGHLLPGEGNTKDQCGQVWQAASPGDIAAMKQMGFNTDRIGVSWANIEPTAPTVNPDGSLSHHWNTQYLAAIDNQVQYLKNNNMMAILDMHQAEWSPYFTSGKLCEGSGMPRWLYTTAPNTSGGVDTAKCEFFSDRAESGVKEKPQEGMGAVWAMLAGRYAGNTTVIGADEFNEPLFSKTCTGADLAAFYEKMGSAIRSSNPNIILMYEDNAYDSYMASGSRLDRKPNLTNALFSWHLYAPDWSTALPPMNAHLSRAQSWNVPLWIGESDAMLGTRSNSMTTTQQQSLKDQMTYFKNNDISWTLWAYDTGCCSVVVKGTTQPKQPLNSILKIDE